MAATDSERSPLLRETGGDATPPRSTAEDGSTENTPLLSTAAVDPSHHGVREENACRQNGNGDLRSGVFLPKRSGRRRKAISIAVLLMLVLAIAAGCITAAIVVPSAVEAYAKQAAVLEPTNLSLESITTGGVRARIQANVRLDGNRVNDDRTRRIGRAVTWLVGGIQCEQTSIRVYLPDYQKALLGTATVPPLAIRLVDGQNNALDFVAELAPGDAESIRNIANEWLEGRLETLRVQGETDLHLKSGIMPLGTHFVSESLTFEASKIPAVPRYDIDRLVFQETPITGEEKTGMAADVTISAFNEYPVSLDIPKLGFDVLVEGCSPHDPYIVLAAAQTHPVQIKPNSRVTLDVHGVVRELPETLTHDCPASDFSPLDMLLRQYLDGEEATVFVRGHAGEPDPGVPAWLAELLSSVTVPVPFPGRSFDSLIRNFSLTDVQFSLPDPMAAPGEADADPKVSGTIVVTAALPKEMNFDLNVTRIRATADVFYQAKKLGELDIRRWQPANSTRVELTGGKEQGLQIQSRIEEAPLNVTDAGVLTDVIQSLLFGGKRVVWLDVDAAVDVTVNTVLGTLVLKDVPAQGKIPVKPATKGSLTDLDPKIGSLRVLDTTSGSMTLQALVNITNPTPYAARVPYASIFLASNGSVVGEALARDLHIQAGRNENLLVSATWNPSLGGDDGRKVGRTLISEYLSGFNTTLDLRAHQRSFPSQPILGEALSRINFTVTPPAMELPGAGEDNETHFIKDATFHIFSSSATFTLLSPFRYNTLYVDHVNATAYYNHSDPVGVIVYDLPFACTPGATQTPKLPVDWSLGSDGYEKMRAALGGTLKLDAKAVVGVRMGSWTETICYEGKGIGARIRL